MKVSVIEGEKNNTGFGEVIVDATIEEVAAIMYLIQGNLSKNFTRPVEYYEISSSMMIIATLEDQFMISKLLV